MPETFKTESYESRESNQLGIGDYLKKHVFSILLPFVGFGVGLGLRKALKWSWLEQPYVFPLYTPEALRNQVEAGAQKTGGYVWRNAESWGAKIGSVWGVYNLWRDRRKVEYSIDDVAKRVDDLKTMESANSYLARENEQLRYQLSNDRPSAQIHRAAHEGAVDKVTTIGQTVA